MFLVKIIVTLLLIQSLQLTFAQQDDDDDLGLIQSSPRFEARRQSSLSNSKEDFEYDDDNASRGPVNPLPARTGRNEDDYDDNQTPQGNQANLGPASVKGQVSPSSSGSLSLPRFPGQQINSFIAPLPAPRPTVVPVAISSPVGKTNFGGDSSGALSVPRLVRPSEGTKTVRVVKTRVFRPDQSESLSTGINGIKSSQVTPTVTRVVRPVLVTRQPTFIPQPVVQPVIQPVVQPVVRPVPIATPITSGSSGVKTVPIVANSKVQPPRLRVITTRRPVAPVDVDEDASAASRPAQISGGVKTIAAANPVPLVPLARFTPTRTLVQPVVQPARQPSLTVIYADQKLNAQEEDEDDEEGNAAGLSQANIVKFNRPLAPAPIRVAPQPYLVPLNVQAPQPAVNRVFFQPTIQPSPRPTIVSSGKTNAIKSTFNVRPQPVPVAPTFVPVAPVQPNPAPILVDSGSASASRTFGGVKGVTPVVSASKVQPPRLRVITTQRPTTPVQIVDEGSLATGVKGSGVASGSRPVVRPVLIRTPAPTTRPLVQVREEPLPTFQQIDLIRTQPAPRPVIIQEQARPTVSFVQPAPRPTAQPIVQIRDGGASAELPLPAPPRPIQIVRVTPAPVRPITQVTQVRESSLPSVQPIQISQPRLIPVAPRPQVVQISEPAQPLVQVRESSLPSVQPVQISQPRLIPVAPRPQPQPQVVQISEPARPLVQVRESSLPSVQPVQISQPRLIPVAPRPQPQPQVVQISEPARPLVQVRESSLPFFQPLDPALRPAIPTVQVTQVREAVAPRETVFRQPVQVVRPQQQQQQQQIVQVQQVQQPSIVETVQLKESAVPITSSEGNLGGAQRVAQPRPTQTLVTVSQEQLPAPAPQSFELLRLREPSFPQFVRQPQQQIVTVRQRPVPAPLPIQTVQPVARPNFVQVSQEKETVSSFQPLAPAPAPVVIQQQQRFVPFPSQPAVPRLVAPLPLPQQQPQSLGQRITVQNRVTQPAVLIQQQRPTIVVSQPQPQPLIIQRQRPVAPVAPLSVQGSLSQSGEQQVVQIREKVSAVDEFSQIEQVRLARA